MAARRRDIETTFGMSCEIFMLGLISRGAWLVTSMPSSMLMKRKGGETANQRTMHNFAQCIFDCSLVDLGYKGPLFTWHSGSLKECLDWALGIASWQSLFPNSSVVNLPLLASDHCGIWLRPIGISLQTDQHYFKFLGGWLEHEDFHIQVKNAWRTSDAWDENISRLTDCLARWNHKVYGNLFHRKKHLLGQIEGIDRKLIEGPNERLSHLKKVLWAEYNSVLDHEGYWFQQAQCNTLSIKRIL